jgi:uncharacterized membrane protein YdjX (TVP38/TMEM64 family)
VNETSGFRFAALGGLALAVVSVPWLVWGASIESWVNSLVQNSTVTPVLVVSIVALLAADVLLPVPSSFVAVAAGVLLGFGLGSVAVLTGLTLGSVLGYVVGARVGSAAARRVVGERGWLCAADWSARYGSSVVLALRPVPVLAEASAFFAGATRMPWGEYLFYSTLANTGVAVVYAGVGELSADTGRLEVALMAGCLLPAVAMVCAGVVRRRKFGGGTRW